ncbi:zinc finger BED domain-containing protein RICESLEEPER 2-like [Rhizophagus clarus]|uniref:Zinc finger BED domain-containing protein RICESLEEPER 2-like n=1 Tax=Rhizophagus clarus TaxID=94130 RepID=A0A8H3QLY3_9GLOM|nr:zinc finger BED domain-containing protein RICESLEEPER 2-like [Rhizophagus clarus]
MTSESGENQVEYDIEEEQGEKNNDHEVEDLRVKKTNMKHNYKRRSTSGMASHIKSKHKLIKEKEKKQLTIRETINNSEAIIYNKDSFKKFLIRWIVKDDLLFTCVESEDFCNMIYLLRKDAFIPFADTVKNYIMTFYEDSHKKIALILRNTSSKIFFTIDVWTSSNNYSFLGITAHWVTESWELKNNASNNVTFLKAVEDDLSQKYIYFNSNDKHVRCLAHVINLAAQQALTILKAVENDETSDEELRILVKKIKASLQQKNKFKAQCKAANVLNLNVMLDVHTRWNSTYDILPLNTLSNSDPTLCSFTINEEEWIHLLEIEELLKVSELYKTLYAPQETQNTNIEYNSSDEDLISHIFKWYRIESVSEFDRYLKADRAQALCDILNWWKRHKEKYPNLSNIARNYFGIPGY